MINAHQLSFPDSTFIFGTLTNCASSRSESSTRVRKETFFWGVFSPAPVRMENFPSIFSTRGLSGVTAASRMSPLASNVSNSDWGRTCGLSEEGVRKISKAPMKRKITSQTNAAFPARGLSCRVLLFSAISSHLSCYKKRLLYAFRICRRQQSFRPNSPFCRNRIYSPPLRNSFICPQRAASRPRQEHRSEPAPTPREHRS